ncbi:MAG: hypothetical protein M0Z33_06540 [Actinomycetota bacterium]|nr:hypothetical protein [Actinomycetota bacterium]
MTVTEHAGKERPPRSAARRLAVGAALTGVVAFAAACGGSPSAGVASLGSTTTSTTAPAPSGAPAPAGSPGAVYSDVLRFAACMRSHGVPGFPQPTISSNGKGVGIKIAPGSGVDPGSKSFVSAQGECRKYLPAGGGAHAATITPAQQADYLKAAACMRSHGIVGFPDPVFNGGQVSFPIPTGMSPSSTSFLRARQICEALIPAGLPYSKQAEGGG